MSHTCCHNSQVEILSVKQCVSFHFMKWWFQTFPQIQNSHGEKPCRKKCEAQTFLANSQRRQPTARIRRTRIKSLERFELLRRKNETGVEPHLGGKPTLSGKLRWSWPGSCCLFWAPPLFNWWQSIYDWICRHLTHTLPHILLSLYGSTYTSTTVKDKIM